MQEGSGEISKATFEAILGPHVEVVQPTATQGYVATVEALEVTGFNTHTSCLVYLDVGPSAGFYVIRRNAGYLAISDWKFEQGKHFCPVEIGGGKYDAGAGETGAFTLSLNIDTPKDVDSFVVSGIGWKAGTNHQHPNIYATLRYLEGPVDPPPIDPPPVDPPPSNEEAKILILGAKVDLEAACAKLDEALELLP